MNFETARFNMVEQQIRPWDVLDFGLLDVLSEIPREKFVQDNQLGYAYADIALPLKNGSYMLEPKIVARMIQGLALQPTDNIIEIGTGSGYATAILAHLGTHVTTYDIDEQQLKDAETTLTTLNYKNITYQHADGFLIKTPEKFDAIYIGGSIPSIPDKLKENLSPKGGRMVVIVGNKPLQHCLLITRQGDKYTQTTLFDTCVTALKTNNLPTKDLFSF